MARLTGPVHSVSRVTRGFSLIELMVAMAISLLLLAGVIAIFASSRASYETTDRMSRIQENGRYALDQLAYDIRSAGYVGCSRATTYVSTSLNNSSALTWNFLDGPVRGYEYVSSGTWAPALSVGVPTTGVTAAVDGSDVLVLRMPVREAVALRLQSDMATGTSDIVLPAVTGAFKVGDIALAYSCEAQAFFQVTGFAGGVLSHTTATGPSGTPGNAVANISYAFRTNAEVLPVNTVVYYIAASTAIDASTSAARSRSLFRKTGSNVAEELVEGVDQMQIDYGVDTNLDDAVDAYQVASGIADWSRVLSVRVALLVRSLDQYGTEQDTRTYTLLTAPNAVAVTAPMDRRYREVFTSTVSVRNKAVIN